MFGNIGGTASQTCKFGLPTLDEVLGGGIPRGQTWLIEDQIGTDYNPLIMSYLANGLQSSDYIYLLSTEQNFDYYKTRFQAFGINPVMQIQANRLRFIDAFTGNYQVGLNMNSGGEFSSGFGQSFGAQGFDAMGGADISETIEYITDLTQPREINEAVRRSLLHVKEGPTTGIRGAVLSLSSIIHASDNHKEVFTFIQNRRAMDNMNKMSSIITIHADAHDPILLRGIEHQMDGVMRVTPVQDPSNPNETLQMVEIIHAKGKAELTGRKVVFRFSSGRIIPA